MNKNTRNKKKLLSKTRKTGQSAVISENPVKNMRQVVLINKNNNYSDSRTFHEVIKRGEKFCSGGKVSNAENMAKPKVWKI